MIVISKLYPDAIVPTRKNPTDAGLDLYAYFEKGSYKKLDESGVGEWTWSLQIPGNSCGIVNTGITVEIPEGYVGLIWPKSRLDYSIGGGVIDAGYQGEILVKVINPSDRPINISEGMAIAQLIIQPILTEQVKEVPKEEIHKVRTTRGETGGIVNQVAYFQSKMDFGNNWD